MGAITDSKHTIAARAARELRDGQVTNLGAGIPMLISSYLPDDVEVVIQTENGMIVAGPAPLAGCEDPDCCNAGGRPATILPGGCYLDTATSFSMIRGGHVDATFLGALQVDQQGDIASYEIPGAKKVGPGGAMDLVVGAKTVYVLTEHCLNDGSSKLMKRCTYPRTGVNVCDVIITERALFRRTRTTGFTLEETARGYTVDDIRACTDMEYSVSPSVRVGAF
jgi:3-oxoacid CoA-transferase B subunit